MVDDQIVSDHSESGAGMLFVPILMGSQSVITGIGNC